MSKKRSALLLIGIVEERSDEKDIESAESTSKKRPKRKQPALEDNTEAVEEPENVGNGKLSIIETTSPIVQDTAHSSTSAVKIKEEPKEEAHGCTKCFYCSDHCPSTQSSGEKKRYQCMDCKGNGLKRTFITQEKLNNHIKTTHDVEESGVVFVCRECEAPPLEFKSKAKYMYHLGSKHPGAVYFVCEICAATFKLKANYREHLATHNIPSKKPFTCEICKGNFVNKAGFEAHKRRFPGHHIKHVCEHCNFSFSKESHILNHRCKKLLLEEAAARLSERSEDIDSPPSPEGSTSTSIITTQTQYFSPMSVSEPIVLQEVQQGRHSSEQIIMADQVIQGGQVVQFDISSNSVGDNGQPVYHVNVADWSMVAPFVIRGPNVHLTEEPE